MVERPQRTLPTALVIGPMKCGTSWIHEYLAARRDVCLPHLVKETFYFDRYNDRGLDWYARRFSHMDSTRHEAIVEVAPSLFHRSDDLPARVRDQLGDIPILITLRDPVSRAWSHYRHLRSGHSRQPLSEAISTFPEIVSASRYPIHMPRWQAVFSHVDVVHQTTLSADPQSYADQVSAALGLPTPGPACWTTGASNIAAQPRSFHLAQLGRAASHGLRRIGLYRLVHLAKRGGLKPLFFGAPNASPPRPSPQEIELLQFLLEGES